MCGCAWDADYLWRSRDVCDGMRENRNVLAWGIRMTKGRALRLRCLGGDRQTGGGVRGLGAAHDSLVLDHPA
jgi:hypothetical protein